MNQLPQFRFQWRARMNTVTGFLERRGNILSFGRLSRTQEQIWPIKLIENTTRDVESIIFTVPKQN
jgi:hypothetical protein